MDEARKALAQARADYEYDMQWLQREYGITADVETYSVKKALLAALDALEANDLPSFQAAVQSFRELHHQVMRYVVWDLLERTKQGIKSLPKSDPSYQEKLRQWNQASWEKHPWRKGWDISSYRKAIEMIAKI